MVGRVETSVHAALATRGSDVVDAARDHHSINLGPGHELEAEWRRAGLELPDLDAMRRYRLQRIQRQLKAMDYGGAILMDPMNIRYATDSTNMQVWVMHNPSRYAWVGADGSLIVWDFYECEFLAAHNPLVQEVRPATSSHYFLAGPRFREKAKVWVDEMADVIAEHAGPGARIAIDRCGYNEYRLLEDAGIRIEDGMELMEMARRIKGNDELLAMRCAVHACEATMGEMREALVPGMTERELWAVLHAGNIRRGGEWVETQILSSGPRTNPWMQEVSSRRIEPGDLVAYDTDLVGPYGMMCDISRTWLAGDGVPSASQQHLHALAVEQVERNHRLLLPGKTFREITFESWQPPIEDYRHYCVNMHGVGQCDEFPEIVFPHMWSETGFDGVLESGMTLTTEAFVGGRHGGEGVKLENQYLVTDAGPELLSASSLSLT